MELLHEGYINLLQPRTNTACIYISGRVEEWWVITHVQLVL